MGEHNDNLVPTVIAHLNWLASRSLESTNASWEEGMKGYLGGGYARALTAGSEVVGAIHFEGIGDHFPRQHS